ncbi:uncharacterized protein G2W53_029805 [Senna tora]|uniref:Uncharacterized protein n=1 Tax=Senna tora TaxID=362788 RepID=A0A834T866_9FABA|nr:uncharacterized protein G2W53_029805 [Senna tora]
MSAFYKKIRSTRSMRIMDRQFAINDDDHHLAIYNI